MSSRASLVAVVAALITLSIGCADATGPDPYTRIQGPATPPAATPVVPRAFPALSRPGQIYVATPGLYASIRNLSSRFVLFTDGTFELQFLGDGEYFAYTGRYQRVDATVTFEWDGWSTAGPWGATGTLTGDQLAVRFNIIMQLSDFLDGTYVRSSGTS